MVDDIEIGSSLNIQEHQNSDNLTIYPNPAKDRLFIDFGDLNSDDLKIEVYNMDGKLVTKYKIAKNAGDNFMADISGLEQGIYLMKIQSPDGTLFKKFIIER